MIVTFGEIMGRMASPGFLRLRQALPGTLDVTFAGAEANVAAAVAMLGGPIRFVTALPKNTLADACVDRLRGLGIDTRHILRTKEGRLGLYFLETGANQRASQVIYDREGSALALTAADRYRWPTIFENARWFHISGITPAVSRLAAEAALAAVQAAKQADATVSCDLNYRNKLWGWDASQKPQALAEATMRGIMRFVDVVFANEEDCSAVFGIRAGSSDVQAGKLEIDRYADVARQVVVQFPNVSIVAITLRESFSASHNNWGAMLHTAKDNKTYFAPQVDGQYKPYEIKNIVDRVGGGDAFAGGLIFALTTPELCDPFTALRFATAASCLAHSIQGDFNYSIRPEIEALMNGAASGRVVR